ncbi:putative quinol monooxygenase [Frondihabitans australicus]|uniref:Quinol monooxygenase YgiN n=1 Tax=Frondihabitans australicus TaxID=386892 RepID=A0A495IKT2_9MICO|nr:antibiotic biosynthesis monooxygenase family protein [Frondihabitans australicus]RKR76587.1 quinol monooxygenase YgiN [Frondihabitans australicus]
MSMTVLLEITLKPDAEGADDIIRETLAQTAAFDGQESLEVLVDDDDPNKIVVVEIWESTAHHAAYDAWRKTPEGASKLGTITAERNKRVFSHTIAL